MFQYPYLTGNRWEWVKKLGENRWYQVSPFVSPFKPDAAAHRRTDALKAVIITQEAPILFRTLYLHTSLHDPSMGPVVTSTLRRNDSTTLERSVFNVWLVSVHVSHSTAPTLNRILTVILNYHHRPHEALNAVVKPFHQRSSAAPCSG